MSNGTTPPVAYLLAEANPHKTATVRDLGGVTLGAVQAQILAIPSDEWDTAADFDANYNKRGALRSTAHIIFRFCDRRQRPAPCSDLPAWERWAPRLLPLMQEVVAPYGYTRGFFPRVMLARLPAGAFISPHADGEPGATRPHKVHVPIVTNPDAYFFVDDRRYHFVEGRAYEVNNATRHAATNGGATDRIHLIFEYLDADLQTFVDEPPASALARSQAAGTGSTDSPRPQSPSAIRRTGGRSD